MSKVETHKRTASVWFAELRNRITRAFEELEDNLPAGCPVRRSRRGAVRPHTMAAVRSHRSRRRRRGVMAIIRGRVFEKAGVHISTVHGEFPPEFRKEVKGAEEDPRFWASGISLIAHPHNPHVPTVHMNTRMVITARQWFWRRR